jgi:methionyl-tRNA formyltransferase
MKLGVLVSGNLGFVVLRMLYKFYQINFVLTDKKSESIIKFCKDKYILFYAGNPRNGNALNNLRDVNCDILVSVNYLFVIENDLISLPKKIAINFHGSLLPKYRGRTPHVWAIINGEKITGITAHKIDEGCDTGDIIEQKTVKISPKDTGASILKKFNSIYPKFVLHIVRKIENDTFQLRKQDETVATYFGKRTPEDGQIDWNWQKERIFNWVRAQSNPYPGAFTYYNREKVIINSVEVIDYGFNYSLANGTILAKNGTNIIVKTPNGCLKLLDFHTNNEIIFEINSVFKNENCQL